MELVKLQEPAIDERYERFFLGADKHLYHYYQEMIDGEKSLCVDVFDPEGNHLEDESAYSVLPPARTNFYVIQSSDEKNHCVVVTAWSQAIIMDKNLFACGTLETAYTPFHLESDLKCLTASHFYINSTLKGTFRNHKNPHGVKESSQTSVKIDIFMSNINEEIDSENFNPNNVRKINNEYVVWMTKTSSSKQLDYFRINPGNPALEDKTKTFMLTVMAKPTEYMNEFSKEFFQMLNLYTLRDYGNDLNGQFDACTLLLETYVKTTDTPTHWRLSELLDFKCSVLRFYKDRMIVRSHTSNLSFDLPYGLLVRCMVMDEKVSMTQLSGYGVKERLNAYTQIIETPIIKDVGESLILSHPDKEDVILPSEWVDHRIGYNCVVVW